MKKIVLELLKLSNDAKNDIETWRLERLFNIRSKEQPLLGLYFVSFLEEMKEEGLIISNDNKSVYSITSKGLEYLKSIEE